MAILRPTGKQNLFGTQMLKAMKERIQKSTLSLLNCTEWKNLDENHGKSSSLPRDVKEGHFAMIAVENGKRRRFVVPLSYLSHARFLMLLEEAAEEFGFDHQGALCIPCPWIEIEKIMANNVVRRRLYILSFWG